MCWMDVLLVGQQLLTCLPLGIGDISVYYPNPVLLCVPACILHAATKCRTVSVGPLHCLHLGSYRVWQMIAFRHLVL